MGGLYNVFFFCPFVFILAWNHQTQYTTQHNTKQNKTKQNTKKKIKNKKIPPTFTIENVTVIYCNSDSDKTHYHNYILPMFNISQSGSAAIYSLINFNNFYLSGADCTKNTNITRFMEISFPSAIVHLNNFIFTNLEIQDIFVSPYNIPSFLRIQYFYQCFLYNFDISDIRLNISSHHSQYGQTYRFLKLISYFQENSPIPSYIHIQSVFFIFLFFYFY